MPTHFQKLLSPAAESGMDHATSLPRSTPPGALRALSQAASVDYLAPNPHQEQIIESLQHTSTSPLIAT